MAFIDPQRWAQIFARADKRSERRGFRKQLQEDPRAAVLAFDPTHVGKILDVDDQYPVGHLKRIRGKLNAELERIITGRQTLRLDQHIWEFDGRRP